jgi:hypothetical protein
MRLRLRFEESRVAQLGDLVRAKAPCYSDRECGALGWTEARLSEGHSHESAYEA